MAGKNKAQPKEVEQAENPTSESVSELATLRQIVFGAAQAELETKLAALEQSMLERFQQSDERLAQHVKDLNTTMQSGFEDIQQRVASVDKQYDNKTAELHAYADKLSSELEMSDTNGRQETDELHARVDKEVSVLTEKYDAKFAEALEKLDQVTKELSSTKTDRKTLAKLLATMAVNLETDED